jgi:ethanolaminephosphotransferase
MPEILHCLTALLAFTQSRASNIPLLLLLSIQFEFLKASNLSVTEITTSSLLFQYVSFFAYGGSNSIASIDLSNAYNGVEGFNVVVIGILTFFSNWVGPIFWVSATNLLLLRLRTSGTFMYHAALLTLFITYSAAFVMAACTVLRSHLFIWTVFSPKYLYCMAWTIGQHLIANIGLGGVLYWIGARDG